jgi:hypothetical protein
MDDHSTTSEEEDVEVFIDPSENKTEEASEKEIENGISKMTNSMLESKTGS